MKNRKDRKKQHATNKKYKIYKKQETIKSCNYIK